MANTGWDHTNTTLQEMDPAEVHHQLEKELPMEEVNTITHECLHEHTVEVTEKNYELLREAVRDAYRHWELTIQKDTQVREQRHRKEESWRQTDLALHSHNWPKDKEHAATVAKAKAHNQEAMQPLAVPPCVPPLEKTLTTMMPHLSVPSVPVSICHQGP